MVTARRWRIVEHARRPLSPCYGGAISYLSDSDNLHHHRFHCYFEGTSPPDAIFGFRLCFRRPVDHVAILLTHECIKLWTRLINYLRSMLLRNCFFILEPSHRSNLARLVLVVGVKILVAIAPTRILGYVIHMFVPYVVASQISCMGLPVSSRNS